MKKNIHSVAVLAVICASLTGISQAAPPTSSKSIEVQSVDVDFEAEVISIVGANFDNGDPPVVTLGGYPVVVSVFDAGQISGALPAPELIPPGDYQLTITTGSAPRQYASLSLTIVAGPVAPQVTCPCDFFFARAVQKYLAWGGAMKPENYGDEWAPGHCPYTPPGGVIYGDGTKYTTEILEPAATLEVSFYTEPGEAFPDPEAFCTVRVAVNPSSAGDPTYLIYQRILEDIGQDAYLACRESIYDYCEDDPPEGVEP